MSADTLMKAVSKAKTLSEADQDRIGRELDAYVDALERLRADLQVGRQSLKAGLGKPLDMNDVITRARAVYERR